MVGLIGHGACDPAFAAALAVGSFAAFGGHGLFLIVVLSRSVVCLLLAEFFLLVLRILLLLLLVGFLLLLLLLLLLPLEGPTVQISLRVKGFP